VSTDVLSVVVVVVRQVVTVHVLRNESSSASQPYVVTAPTWQYESWSSLLMVSGTGSG
jgi:hypothetical protein